MNGSRLDELIQDRRIEEFRDTIQDALCMNANDPKFRRVAGRAYVALAGVWGLTRPQAASFLGIEESEYQAWLDEEYGGLGADQLEKISCLLGIYKYLATLYSRHMDRVQVWMKKDNNGKLYGGKSPYQLLDGADTSVFHLVRRDLAAATV